ncbi:prepilin peptidase [Aureimonas sp. AU12]|uniref:prepilin peptidase n=1 Tax=Aureimonas sp. AU12 TaxID=1638161 RepID=UPI00078435D7|nr:prepilin peptidase [Aureimonas sp. AU12]
MHAGAAGTTSDRGIETASQVSSHTPGVPPLTLDWLFVPLLLPLLAVVTLVDARSGRIPDTANAAILLLGALRAGLEAPAVLAGRLLDAAIVAALLALLRFAYHRRRGHHGLGLGDVKFLAAATVWTGLAALPALVLAASLAALARLAWARWRGGAVGWQTRLRFGPYLAIALLAVLIAAALVP